jgi:DNA-binding NarL/FixJ family response regulator
MPIRALLVDDNASFLEAARVLLEQGGIRVVGSASTSADGLRLAEQLRPDVILVDIGLGNESGFALARRLADQVDGDGTAIILVSTHAESDLEELIADSPAIGYLPKSELSAEAIRRTLEQRSG